MSATLSTVVREVLPDDVPESAMETVVNAIVKLISDGFVRKELYKEKLAEVCTLNESLVTAQAELSTAESKITEYITEFNKAELTKKSDKLVADINDLLNANGVNPHFSKLLLNELLPFASELGDELSDTDILGYLQEKTDLLKTEYPQAFGELSVEKAAVAMSPIRIHQTNNPWKRECLDLEEQTRIFRENPEKARVMAHSAGIKL